MQLQGCSFGGGGQVLIALNPINLREVGSAALAMKATSGLHQD